MKVLILAGGLGTRFVEETQTKPKPLIEIFNKPLLVHIIEHYSYYGFFDFVIAGGYKYKMIQNYFQKHLEKIKSKINKNITVKVINTGVKTMTGGRILKASKFLNTDFFFLTYGDGLSNLDIQKSLINYLKNKSLYQLTAVQPIARFGSLSIKRNGLVSEFKEKFVGSESWVNGGFFILNKKIIKYIKSDQDIFEVDILPKISKQGLLHSYKFKGFWYPVDTIRDKQFLESFNKNSPPWQKYE